MRVGGRGRGKGRLRTAVGAVVVMVASSLHALVWGCQRGQLGVASLRKPCPSRRSGGKVQWRQQRRQRQQKQRLQ